MSIKRLIDVDPEMGMVQYMHTDAGEGTVLENVGTNVQQVLDGNAAMRQVNNEIPKGDQTWMHHVGRVPMWLWTKWCKENPELRQFGPDAQKWLMAKLNSREFRHLRTYDGRV